MIVDYSTNLLKNIHESLPTFGTGKSTIIRGIYEYWHYGCDGFNDRGWGCGYRTLQTICSWIIINKNLQEKVPSIRKIQETLVTLEDKEKPFIGSRDWIGCFEVCLILDNLYNVNSKIVHIRSGQELSKYLHIIRQHFEEFGCPIMMGGDQDCSSKCIIGMHIGLKEVYLLIVDPHFIGKAKSIEELKNNQWVRWQSIRDFVYSSFYNLCLPQIKIT
ncbi:probable Ufm1-specific protease 1 [Vespa velutina]|uniref:probable Ufm1-specific protease 1 n=1 Tax=Vespa velutina TaxID=202808 RepID=UPI001FB49FEF|nr:probable Ufm1-specific protease 1 [Vespa velutina]